jgi:hypothetical protein
MISMRALTFLKSKENNHVTLEKVWNFLKKKVFPIPSTNLLFNQYNDTDLSVDLPNADKIRRENLMSYLRSFAAPPSVFVVGEAPGPWGCRFSGVPFTSESQLCRGELPFSGSQSSVSISPYSGKAAKIFWALMLPYHQRFFVWNCIPFHPHEHDNILSVRNPKRREVREYSQLLSEMLSLIKPEIIVSVGRKAQDALDFIGVSSVYVRHPSRGGKNKFKAGIERIFKEQ